MLGLPGLGQQPGQRCPGPGVPPTRLRPHPQRRLHLPAGRPGAQLLRLQHLPVLLPDHGAGGWLRHSARRGAHPGRAVFCGAAGTEAETVTGEEQEEQEEWQWSEASRRRREQ